MEISGGNWALAWGGRWGGGEVGRLMLTNFRQEDKHNKMSFGSGRHLANLENELFLRNIADAKGYLK